MEQHQGLLAFEAIHRDHVHGLANLGSGKGQCVLYMQQCIDIRNHQCGVFLQVSVLLGQTYDAGYFPIMPVMMRPASIVPQSTPPLPVPQESEASTTQAIARVDNPQTVEAIPDISVVESAPPNRSIAKHAM